MSILGGREGNVQDYLKILIRGANRRCKAKRNFRHLTLSEELGRRIWEKHIIKEERRERKAR